MNEQQLKYQRKRLGAGGQLVHSASLDVDQVLGWHIIQTCILTVI